uniref:Secreted protein n=1 Tax=Steinernema glaseri TaxID=37863 RepID=A0A1I7YR32_9BILA
MKNLHCLQKECAPSDLILGLVILGLGWNRQCLAITYAYKKCVPDDCSLAFPDSFFRRKDKFPRSKHRFFLGVRFRFLIYLARSGSDDRRVMEVGTSFASLALACKSAAYFVL